MKTKNIGFLLTNIDNSNYYNELFQQISLLIKNNPYHHICIFNSHSEKINTMNVPILHINQAKFFDGNMFIFDISSLHLIKNFPLIEHKYFVAQDINWIRSYNNYQEWRYILEQDNLDIIASNQYIYDIYDICWKKPVAIMESISYENISKLL